MTAGIKAVSLKTNYYYWYAYKIILVGYETDGEEFIITTDIGTSNLFGRSFKYSIDTDA